MLQILKRDPNDNYGSEGTNVMERICNLSVPEFRSDRLCYKIKLLNVRMIILYICRFAENSLCISFVTYIYFTWYCNCSPPDCCEGFQDYIWIVHFQHKQTLLPILHVIVNNMFEWSYFLIARFLMRHYLKREIKTTEKTIDAFVSCFCKLFTSILTYRILQ